MGGGPQIVSNKECLQFIPHEEVQIQYKAMRIFMSTCDLEIRFTMMLSDVPNHCQVQHSGG